MSQLSDEEKFREIQDNEDFPAYRLILSRELCISRPNRPILYLDHAFALGELSRYTESLRFFDKAEATWGDGFREILFSKKGALYRVRNDFLNARVCYQKAIEFNPTDTTYHIFLGATLARQGCFDLAEEAYRNALDCYEGDFDEVYLNLGLLYRAQERFEEALDFLEKARVIDPTNEITQEAIDDIQKAQRFVFNNNFIKDKTKSERLNIILEADMEMAAYRLVMSRKLSEDYPNFHKGYIQYAHELKICCRYDEARSVLEKAFQCCPQERLWVMYLMLGFFYENKGEYRDVVRCFRRSIELKPGYADSHNNLGVIYYELEQYDEAEACFKKACQCDDGDSVEGYYNLGLVLRSREQFTEAGKCFETCLELDPEYDEARDGLGDIQKVLDYLG